MPKNFDQTLPIALSNSSYIKYASIIKTTE